MTTEPSLQQKSIIELPLTALSVIACAGSGKTFTAVRRVDAVRGLLKGRRGHVALLSFSNVAVDVFGQSYLEDFGGVGYAGRSRVYIETFDGFITKNILRTHASQTMRCACMPFLLTGEEEFLSNRQYQFWPQGLKFPAKVMDVEVEASKNGPRFFWRTYQNTVEITNGQQAIRKLGEVGAYTHAFGRYWAYMTLKEQPKIAAAFVRRYPQIVVDEAQDIGSMQIAFLELLATEGAEISLIGDPNQAIFEFSGADGTYLREYPSRKGVQPKELTTNYRSVPRIVKAANSITKRKDDPFRKEPTTDNGVFFLPFGKGQEGSLIAAFERAVQKAGLSLNKSAIVCRATKKKLALRNLGQEYGQGAVRHFTSATIARDLACDYQEAFKHTVYAIIALLKAPPRHLCAGIFDPARFPEYRQLRKLIWEFTRDPKKGLPSGTLHAELEWHIQLVLRVRTLLDQLQSVHKLDSHEKVSMRLKKTGLPKRPLIDPNAEKSSVNAALRVETIHGVKGESLDAVLYLADKEHIKAMVNGIDTELGRIGYVALTRARDLFWLGVTKEDAEIFRESLTSHTFVERNYEEQLGLPIQTPLLAHL